MKLRKLSAAGFVSALLVGSLGLGASSAAADDGYGTVTGKVTLNGKAVVGASVSLAGDDYSSGGYGETDSAGVYTIKWADPGTWVVRVDNYDFDPVTYDRIDYEFLTTYSGNTVREPDATKVNVTAGGSTSVDVKVQAGATITGKVVDAKGKAVAGVDVTGSNSTRSGYSSATTDSQGRYVLRGLATGPVEVSARTVTGADRYGGVSKVPAVQGKSVAAKTLRITAPKLGTIKATVKGVKVGDSIWLYDTKFKYAFQIVNVEKKGSVKVNHKVAPGNYRVIVGGTNKASKAVTVKAKKSTKAGTLKVSKKRTKISGTVKASNGKKARDVSVRVNDSYGTYTGSAITNKKGKYSVTGAVAGSYTVHAFDASLKNASTDVKVTVKKGKKAKKNFKLGKAYRVTGTIKHAGKPVVGVNVYGLASSAATNAQGKFTIRGLGKGKTQIGAYDAHTGGYRNAIKTVTIKKKNVTWNPTLKK